MQRHTIAAIALGLVTSVTAQSSVVSASPPLGSVVSLFLLDTDPQPLVASYIGMSNSLTTLAINCPPGTPDSDCGYPQPFTITANPSTITASASYDGISLNYGCTLTGTTTGTCSVTYVGQASDLASNEGAAKTATGISTVSTVGGISAADITLFPITVTAGNAGAAGLPAGSGSGSGAGAVPTYGSGSGSGSGAGSGGAGSSGAAGSSQPQPTQGSGGSGSGSGGSAGSGSGAASSAAGGNAAGSSSGMPNPIATYSKADAYKIAAGPGMLGAALLGLAAFL